MCSSTIKQIIAQRVADALIAYKANQKSDARTNDGASGSAGGVRHTDRGCSYKELLNRKPFKYATCTLLDGALTWWNAYAQFIGLDVAYETSWKKLKKMMTKEYCPRNELQKMEIEFWNLLLEGIDMTGYIWGLKEEIKGNVTSFKPITIQDAIRMSHDLMDQVVRGKVTRDADNKRKREDDQSRYSSQNKRHEVVRGYAVRLSDLKGYPETLPLCDKCKLHHHHGSCPVQ
ncbi:hypothetical protein Tco_0666767 [Tanacetum coccineum]